MASPLESIKAVDLLLQECEQLDHNGRMKRMVRLGQESLNNTLAKELVTVLLHGSLYEQFLGLQTCYGSRDVNPALDAIAFPSRLLNVRAIRLVALLANDVQSLGALKSVQPDLRAALVYRLRRKGRTGVIDAYLEQLIAGKDGDDQQLKRLLPFASKDKIEEWLPRVVDRFRPSDWARLFQFHSKIVHGAIREWSSRSETPDPLLLKTVNRLIPLMAATKSASDMAIDLIRLLLKWASLSQLDSQGLQALLKKCPQGVAQLIIDCRENVSLSFGSAAQKLPLNQLLTLVERHPDTISKWDFGELTSEQRVAVYHLVGSGWRSKEGVLPSDIVGALPTKERIAEARRHLKLPSFVSRPLNQIDYAQYLPWDEGMAIQLPYLQSNEMEVRSLALQKQITATIYQEAHLNDVLQLVLRHRSDQDPVRLKAIEALRDLPPSRWKENHVSDLTRIIRSALDASDLSFITVYSLLSLVIRLLLFYPEWAAAQLSLIMRERDQLPRSFNLCGNSSVKHSMRYAASALLPILHRWHETGKERSLISLAEDLEDRVKEFPELLDILEQVLKETRVEYIASDIIYLLAKYRPQRLRMLAPHLLKEDPTFINLDRMKDYVHTHCQNLLTPFLSNKAYEGRFSKGKVGFVPCIYKGFQRWTMTQQETFARTQVEIIKEAGRPTTDLPNNIKQLAGLCFVDAGHLIPFASDKRLIVRAAALRALSELEAGHGIPTMAEALSDERASTAIYSLRRSLKRMPKPEALKLLQAVPMTKVTVAKEVIRLIGDLKSEDAYQYILKMDKTDLHPDIYAALLRSLWSYLERPESWRVFRRAAESPNPTIAKAIAHVPAALLTPQTQASMTEVLAILLVHSKVEVRLDALRYCSSLPPCNPKQILTSRLLELLQSPLPDEASCAAEAVFKTHGETQTAIIGEAFKTLLKDRQALSNAFPIYMRWANLNRQRMLPQTQAILDILREDPLAISLRLKLMFRDLPYEELRDQILSLGPELHADALVEAETIIHDLRNRPDVQWSDLELVLAPSKDEKLRRLALAALLAQANGCKGWTEELRLRLLGYQKDESLLVASAACFIFPPVESE